MTASPSPELLAEFYTYLTEHGEFRNPTAREKLSLQLRDILLKQVTLLGAPQVLMAITPLAATQGEPQQKAQESQLSGKW